MLRSICHWPRVKWYPRINAVLGRGSCAWLVRTMFYGLYTLSAHCDAATLQPTQPKLQQLTEVWREAFPLVDDEMAPLSSTRSLPANKPTAPWAGVRARTNRPHPAVARIVVPEEGAISFGSGTLIDVRENFGMVITNWHVVRDAADTIEVIFPDGFTSKARALKVDSDWDLAALVVWRPNGIDPVSIAPDAPRPGDPLTICGYGQGNYRCATGRCTQYYAPRLDFPRHMVELDVEARQGDSGGPIFNTQGELAGVLFGAGQGTTLGSFGGRVGAFLATLAPDIGRAEAALAKQSNQPTDRPSDEQIEQSASGQFAGRPAVLSPHQGDQSALPLASSAGSQWPANSFDQQLTSAAANFQAANQAPHGTQPVPTGTPRANLFEQVKTALAAVGFVTVVVQVLRVAQ